MLDQTIENGAIILPVPAEEGTTIRVRAVPYSTHVACFRHKSQNELILRLKQVLEFLENKSC
jgi:hypothetical protein